MQILKNSHNIIRLYVGDIVNKKMQFIYSFRKFTQNFHILFQAGTKLSDVYNQAVGLINSEKPSLVNHFTKSVG